MTCPECNSEQVVFRVPADCRDFLPEESEQVALCCSCLALEPTDSAVTESPDFGRISDSFPTGDAGVAMALAVGLLDSLALYRSEISALLERVEREGSDPLLVLNRLDENSELDAHFAVERRRTQAEQLLYE